MTRSHRYRPFAGIACADSDADAKRAASKRVRRHNRLRLLHGAEYHSEFASSKELYDIGWLGNKDGKRRLDLSDEREVICMRK